MLDHIHRHIEDGTLSFIIGAGFSTNISTKFPLWGDLLKPLVGELYPACAGGKKELQEREVQRIIAEKGILKSPRNTYAAKATMRRWICISRSGCPILSHPVTENMACFWVTT